MHDKKRTTKSKERCIKKDKNRNNLRIISKFNFERGDIGCIFQAPRWDTKPSSRKRRKKTGKM